MLVIVTAAAFAALLQVQVAPREPQGVDYRIEARLDEETDVLTARARIRYTNRAAEPLDTLWFHEHLNAFRPGSDWSRRDEQMGIERFQNLGSDEHAYERLTRVEVGGRAVRPVYPGAPDSTVVAIPLPSTLETGETAVIDLGWEARLSTLPRRQGRRGRAFDFAQWYPRIAAYTDEGWQVQPLMPQGEFFGEFASYDVTLEVADDQVMAGTGVPVEGDPGWEAAAREGFDPEAYRRDFYDADEEVSLGLFGAEPANGMKRVRWRAEDVHHFAWSINPDFIYEGGEAERADPADGEIAVHVLYTPEDVEWRGVALERTITALEWLQDVFGPYPWPQLTNLSRVEEGGGTEFPMMVMNGSPSEGLIVHETAHQFVHGLLANNEFREGWMDEGFADYVTQKFADTRGRTEGWAQTLDYVLQFERAGATQPVATPGADFADPQTYSAMTYAKPQLVLRMLEGLIGEEAMLRVLSTYFDQYAPGHVSEEDFRAVAEQVVGRDLDWFFDQWLHTTDQLDYRLAGAVTRALPGGGFETRVTVERAGEAWMPVTLQVGEEQVVLEGRDRQQIATVRTEERPDRAALDPAGYLLDLNPRNNSAPVRE